MARCEKCGAEIGSVYARYPHPDKPNGPRVYCVDCWAATGYRYDGARPVASCVFCRKRCTVRIDGELRYHKCKGWRPSTEPKLQPGWRRLRVPDVQRCPHGNEVGCCFECV